MARITVEDCIKKITSRFELIMIASQRARHLHTGDEPTIEKENDKNTVIALREIADETISIDLMKENLIKEYQNFSNIEEEEASSKQEENDAEKSSNTEDSEIEDFIKNEEEVKELISENNDSKENDSELSKASEEVNKDDISENTENK
tara:strand:- start:1360 stop:1806 length:447 start_codon:yes stop_codon:yes gene_type:complete